MIITVTLNPVLDRTLTVPQFTFNDVLRATNTRLDWGGKGLNVSRALKVMGKDSLASGFLGGATGNMLENGLQVLGIGTQFIHVQGETRTNVIIIDKDASKHIKVNEAGPKIKPEEIEALLHFTEQRAQPGDIWAFCGSLPPAVPKDIYARLISIVQEKGAKAILDTSGEALRLGCMAKPFLIKPNMLEAEVVTGFPIRSEEDVVQAAHKFIEMGIEIAAISMGAKGLFIASHNNTARVYPPSIKEKNPTGAGDALLGGIIWALDQGFPLESIARWGVAAGTAAASLNGVSIGTKEEIESLYGLLDPSYPALPGYLMTSEIGSFARSTIEERKPIIIRQVTEDFAYPPEIVQSLTEFTAEIASQPIQPLSEKADDVTFWNQEMSLYAGRTWLELPWYFAETWFYRRLLECTHYLQPGDWKDIDPFQKQKEKQIQADTKRLSSIWEQFAGLDSETLFTALLHSCLWGNRTDLSNFTVKVKAAHGLATQGEVENILIDDTQQVHDLLSKRVKRVDFINDNSGIDVLFDLVLADYILQQDWSQEVIFNLKQRPFFVSDAMPKDILFTLEVLKSDPTAGIRALAQRLEGFLSSGRLVLRDDPFWSTCLMFRRMPKDLCNDLAQSDLVILKGDVNYRRVLDDRHWDYTTPMEKAGGYIPAPFLLLRTLKGELMVGLNPGQAEKIMADDPTWLINGKRGVIALFIKEKVKK